MPAAALQGPVRVVFRSGCGSLALLPDASISDGPSGGQRHHFRGLLTVTTSGWETGETAFSEGLWGDTSASAQRRLLADSSPLSQRRSDGAGGRLRAAGVSRSARSLFAANGGGGETGPKSQESQLGNVRKICLFRSTLCGSAFSSSK